MDFRIISYRVVILGPPSEDADQPVHPCMLISLHLMLFGELSNKVIATISGGQRRSCPHCLHLVHMHFYKEPLFEYHIKKKWGDGGGREGAGEWGGGGGGKMSSGFDFFF